MNRLSLRKNRLKFENAENLPVVVEEPIGKYTPNE